jgi:hypothetical protein
MRCHVKVKAFPGILTRGAFQKSARRYIEVRLRRISVRDEDDR